MGRSGEAQLHQHWLKTKTRFYMPVATRPDWQPIRSGVRQQNAGQAGTDLDEFDVNIANLQGKCGETWPPRATPQPNHPESGGFTEAPTQQDRFRAALPQPYRCNAGQRLHILKPNFTIRNRSHAGSISCCFIYTIFLEKNLLHRGSHLLVFVAIASAAPYTSSSSGSAWKTAICGFPPVDQTGTLASTQSWAMSTA